MPARNLSRTHAAGGLAAASAIALWAGACASSDAIPEIVRVTAADHVEVTYGSDDRRFTLRNAGTVSDAAYLRGGLYGQTESPDVKIGSDELLNAVVNKLFAAGMAEHGASAPAPGARRWLSLRINDDTKVWSRRIGDMSQGERERFEAAVAAYLSDYNSVLAFHSGKVDARDLERSVEEQRQRNEEAMRSINSKTGR